MENGIVEVKGYFCVSTYEDIRNDESIKCYITEADRALSALGYTEHSFPPRGESGDDGGDDFINFKLSEANG